MMNNSLLSTVNARADTVTSGVDIPQLRIPAILGVGRPPRCPWQRSPGSPRPRLAGRFAGTGIVPMMKALIVCLTAGLAWQFVLDPSHRPRAADAQLVDGPRGALAPLPAKSTQRTGVGGRIWLIVIPLILAFVADRSSSHVCGTPEPGVRHARRVGRRQGISGRCLGLVRRDPCAARVHERKLVAVCFLFSFLNPAHELKIKEIFAQEFPEARLSLSYEVLPQIREFLSS